MGLPMDEVDVEIAPGADLAADPSTWTWVSICDAEDGYPDGRVQRPVSIKVGGESEGTQASQSWCELVVRNEDGAFTPANPLGPWFGSLGKGTPLRVTWSGSERFSGFISELPTTWLGIVDNSRVRVRADGITRRLEQGAESLRSAVFRSLSTHDNVVAYWPCEESSGASQASSPIEGVRPWRLPAEFSAVEGPAGSDQLVRVVTGTPSTLARVPTHTAGDVYVVQVAWRMDEAAPAGGRHMLNVFTTSSDLNQWIVSITDTSFVVRAWDGNGSLAVNSSEAISSELIGQWVRVELRLFTNSTAVDWAASVTAAEADGAVLNDLSGTETSSVKGRIVRVGVGDGGDWAQDRYFGHLAVLTGTRFELPAVSSMDPLTGTDRHAPYHGWTGELAADRFERLCNEEGLACTILAPTGGLEKTSGLGSDNASAPDDASFDVTDLDVRCWLSAADWGDGTSRGLVERWVTTGDQRSFILSLGTSDGVSFVWSTDGTSAGTQPAATSAALSPLPPNNGRAAVRATLDVNNGAAGHDVTLYAGPSLDGPWTQIHSETRAGTTSIHAGTAGLVVGDTTNNGTPLGVVHAVRVYDGIDGTLVADPDFTAQTVGATSFTDDAGNTWTVNGDAEIVRADDSMPMGPQQIDTLIANIQACVDADGGLLTDLTFRTRAHLYNQDPVEIDFCDLNGAPELSDDDRFARNDVTVSWPGGSSARLADPAHIARHGRYDETVTLNLVSDDWARQMAGWRLSIGTTEAARWPIVPLMISIETQHLLADWLALRIGDRIAIPHDVPQIPGVDVDLLVLGWTETIYSRRAERILNCVPASPYNVAVFSTARFDAADSQTSGSFVAGADTSLTVVTAAGSRPWVNTTDHASEFPFHIKVSGVVLNVTAISGSTSPQTFTVDATTVNGVTKTIPSGSAVVLADTPAFAL